MKVVLLNEDVFDTKPIEVTVGPKAYKQLIRLKQCGGFVRFTVKIKADIKGATATPRVELIEYLSKIFANKPLLETMF